MNKEIRCFIGVSLTVEFSEQLQSVVDLLQPQLSNHKLRWIPAQNWHMTLTFLGNQSLDLLTKLELGLQQALHGDDPYQTSRFIVPATQITPFPHKKPRMIVVELERTQSLLQLKMRIDQVLSGNGIDHDNRIYHPHISLARNVLGSTPCLPVKLNQHSLKVDHIKLYQSSQTAHGSLYKALWTLQLNP